MDLAPYAVADGVGGEPQLLKAYSRYAHSPVWPVRELVAVGVGVPILGDEAPQLHEVFVGRAEVPVAGGFTDALELDQRRRRGIERTLTETKPIVDRGAKGLQHSCGKEPRRRALAITLSLYLHCFFTCESGK